MDFGFIELALKRKLSLPISKSGRKPGERSASDNRPTVGRALPTEQTRIIQILVDRVAIDRDGLRLRFRDEGLAQMLAEIGIITGNGKRVAA